MARVVGAVLAALLFAVPTGTLAQPRASDPKEPKVGPDSNAQVAAQPQTQNVAGAQGDSRASPRDGTTKPEGAGGASGLSTDPAASQPGSLVVKLPDPKPRNVGRPWFADCSDPYAIRLGCVLRILATGKYASALREAGASKIRLVFDDVPIPELPIRFEEPGGKDQLAVNITLTRYSEPNGNRRAWDAVFNMHTDPFDYLMKVSVGLEIDGKPTIRAQPDRIPFFVASGKLIWTVVVAGLLVFVGAFRWLIRNDSVLRDSKGGSYSLGKAQMAFWGLIVLLCFLGLWIVTGEMERIPGQVLVLIGISAATGLGAVVIGSSRRTAAVKERQDALAKLESEKAAQLADETSPESSKKERLTREIELLANSGGVARLTEERTRLQQDAASALKDPQSAESQRLKQIEGDLKVLYDLGMRPPGAPNFLQDILDDGNGVSFHRLQTVLWTVVLGIVFIRSVSQAMTMPEFSDTLLTLMAISNGTYLGFKFPEPPTT